MTEQAKGVLAARLGVEVWEAFERWRLHARSWRQELGTIAAGATRSEVSAELAATSRGVAGPRSA